jgi:tryptophan-rich sensory protein
MVGVSLSQTLHNQLAKPLFAPHDHVLPVHWKLGTCKMWSCEGGLNHVAWELKHVLYVLYAYQVFNEMAKGINSHFFYSWTILQG